MGMSARLRQPHFPADFRLRSLSAGLLMLMKRRLSLICGSFVVILGSWSTWRNELVGEQIRF